MTWFSAVWSAVNPIPRTNLVSTTIILVEVLFDERVFENEMVFPCPPPTLRILFLTGVTQNRVPEQESAPASRCHRPAGARAPAATDPEGKPQVETNGPELVVFADFSLAFPKYCLSLRLAQSN